MSVNRQRMNGFSLLEAMVTAFVLAIGLLGMAGLQGRSLGSNHSSYLRSQAVIMAYDMMDRMRANRNAATWGGSYDRTYGDAVPTQVCTSSVCSPVQMANADEKEWIESVQKLPSGDGEFSVNLGTDVVTIKVHWDNAKTGDANDWEEFTLVTVL